MKYYTAKETAVIIRKCLKEAFPNTKFSVRINGFNAVRISWTDGPNIAQVESITNRFRCSRFGVAMYQGEQCTFADYITTSREFSLETVQRACNMVAPNLDASTAKNGEYWNIEEMEGVFIRRNLQATINEKLWKISEYATFDSKTARSVFVTHCDGKHSSGPINHHVEA